MSQWNLSCCPKSCLLVNSHIWSILYMIKGNSLCGCNCWFDKLILQFEKQSQLLRKCLFLILIRFRQDHYQLYFLAHCMYFHVLPGLKQYKNKVVCFGNSYAIAAIFWYPTIYSSTYHLSAAKAGAARCTHYSHLGISDSRITTISRISILVKKMELFFYVYVCK